jgi:2-octaprenyl-6-methoxyphenol hydroxylase
VDYDILIIGGGIVGISLVSALSHLPLRIALIEQKPLSIDSQKDWGGRPIALNYASSRILKNLIPWSDLAAHINPIETVHISEQGRFAAARIKAREMNVPVLGYVIPANALMRIFTQALMQKAALMPLTLHVLNPAQCVALTKHHMSWQAVIKQNDQSLTLFARLVIAADGSHSSTRQLVGIDIQNVNEGQTAVSTTLHMAHPSAHTAYQRFTKQGIIAGLPLLGNKLGFVWTAPNALIAELTLLNPSDFLTRIQHVFAYRLGKFLAYDTPSVSPIKSFIAAPQAQPGFILLGNAAHTLSPIAAQGLNLALQDMASLVDILTKVLDTTKDLADPRISQDYLTARLPVQKQLLRFTEHLPNIFKLQFGPLTLLRNSGLLAFDLIPYLKRNTSRRLMGIYGRLPSLVRSS